MISREQLLAIGLLTGGLGCCGIGLLQAQETADFVQSATAVQGQILSLDRKIAQHERIERQNMAGKF